MNIMTQNEITVADIQPKKTAGESCNTRIRKAWSLQMTDLQKEKFKHFPGSVKQQLYKTFDSEVQQIWTDLMTSTNQRLEKDGVKIVKTKDGYSHFSDEHAIDVDELLIQAAKIWLDDFSKRSPK